MLEWKHGVISTDTLFDCAVVSFYFGYMLISWGYVKYGMKIGEVSSHGFELVVGQDDGNAESTCDICANDSFKMLDDVAVINIVQFTSCVKFDVFRDTY